MSYSIEHLEYYLPEKIIDNQFLAENCGIDRDFLENKIGIKERRIASPDEPTSELAFRSAAKLIENNGIDRDKIDLLLLCTQNPDYRLPTTACLVHEKLKLNKKCVAFDVNLGCSGFVYSSMIAGNMIDAGQVKNALVIMADEYSRIIDYKDKNTASLFGDAASASLFTGCKKDYGFIDFDYGTDGSGAMQLVAFNSGVAANPEKSSFLYMNGREIYKFALSVVPGSVQTLLERNHLKKDDVKYFIFHQANRYMLGEIRKKLALSEQQTVIDMELYGNTVSSSIPIAYRNLIDKKKLKKDDLIVFCGFGVGLSWATALYRYAE